MYVVVTARKGISRLQLSKEIGVTQKTAWFLLGRLREACGHDPVDKLKGVVEVDETFIGGIEGNKHEAKKLHAGTGGTSKQAVIGLRERAGKSIALPVKNVRRKTLQGVIAKHVEPGSKV